MTVQTTFGGAGVIHGDLTPECAGIVGTVLDALAAPAGAGDERTQGQRYHDALHEAMRRLVAGGLLPERAGQPVKALVHISLADLIRLDGSPALLREWIASMRARWAAHRAAASESGSDGGAWLEGKAAGAAACDASVTPVVTGDVDPGVLDELVRLCIHLDRLRRDGAPGPGGRGRACARCSSSRSSPPPSRCSPDPAAWPRICGAGSSAPAWPAPACPWTSASAPTSRPRSAAP